MLSSLFYNLLVLVCQALMLTLQEYTLTVTGEGMTETVFTLEDLKTKFPKVDVTTVIQCNGNRREDFHYFGNLIADV